MKAICFSWKCLLLSLTAFCTHETFATVDLVLVPEWQLANNGTTIDISLSAQSTEQTQFSGMDVVLTWDPNVLELEAVLDDGPHDWNFLFGFLPDSQLDGLNDSFLDGNALFQAMSLVPAIATAEGLHVCTFRFVTLCDTPVSQVVIEAGWGEYSVTQVLAPGAINVTGGLGTAHVMIGDAAIPAASETGLIVFAVALAVLGSKLQRRRAFRQPMVRKS
jgi:hypothetical protein